MNKQYDLMYCGEYRSEIESLILVDFPQAEINDASDTIHAGRFSVEIELSDWELTKLEKPDYLKLLIKQVIVEQKNEV